MTHRNRWHMTSTANNRPGYYFFILNSEVGVLYKGLIDFMTARENRNYHFGKGISEDYFFSDRMRDLSQE